ncbi:FAD-dependent monooxygenase [Kineosporia babensis]|uniref:FAD-dependent monooxygenase n=1 Tax=Kineosporia babensis TaxID=499548 RepID=A0A9X1NBI4_9ACTN|nr:FAD-dependent monooxygenase [Kineosporia babensis]MCD5310665.1 FAD-dependent monooxygenase [Kineosporia babensis]
MPRLDDLPLTQTQVLVVGAGPTGLMAGLVLARRRVPALVIDHKSGPTRESRALAVQARTMEIYDQLGLAERVLDGAYPATRMQIRPDLNPQGFDVAAAQRDWTRFPGLQIFEQSRNENLLLDALTERDAGVRWQHRLLDLRSDGPDQGVVALVESPDGLARIQARWCIGADGAASSVRRQLNVPFEGVTDNAMFCVADLRGVTGIPDRSLAMRLGQTTFAVLFPLGPDGHARLITMVNDEIADQETVLANVHSDLGLTWDKVDWFSKYRVHHRVATHFRQGATFLAGDAAHVHSPVGGQGMNTGLQDAHKLANLLADVADQHVSPAALDRYERERRPVAVRLVRVTDRAFGVIARRGSSTAWLRRRGGRLMAFAAPRLLTTATGAAVAGMLGQYRIRYHFVPKKALAPSWADDSLVGLRLPPSPEADSALRSFSWQLHTYGTPAARPDVPGWITGPHAFEPDTNGRLRPDRVYLIRPDGFVAASLPVSGGVVDQASLRSALKAHEVLDAVP